MDNQAMDYENPEGDRYEEDAPRYRDPRSASPRPTGDDGHEPRRSASPNGHADRVKDDHGSNRRGGGGGGGSMDDDDSSINPGSNLFVTGIHPKLTEGEVTRVFEKYGEVEKCQIMRDPHTKESRGFGFVKMVTSQEADAAKDGLQGEIIEGRTLSIEKARRARPRTPTPGKYFGPPKRGDGPERRGGGGRYGGGGGRYGGRDDPYRYRGGGGGGFRDDRGSDRDRSYRDDRGGYGRDYDRDRSYRDDRGAGYGRDYDRGAGYERRERGGEEYGGSRYGGGREDRYAGGRGGDERRAPGYERDRGYERADRDGPRSRDAAASGYGESGSRPEGRDAYGGAP
ncbi:putative RRM domain-containing protein [Seiridium cardinale]